MPFLFSYHSRQIARCVVSTPPAPPSAARSRLSAWRISRRSPGLLEIEVPVRPRSDPPASQIAFFSRSHRRLRAVLFCMNWISSAESVNGVSIFGTGLAWSAIWVQARLRFALHSEHGSPGRSP